MSSSASDEELAALAVAAKDALAFETLVKRYQGLVRGFLGRLTGNAALADDLAQETFFRAFRSLRGYTGAGGFKSWLCAIAYREFLQARRKRAAVDQALAKLRAEPEPASGPWDPADTLALDRALQSLSEDERAAVVMNFALGLSHAEIARTLDKPLGTVKTLIARGRETLKARLSPEPVLCR
ncbi:MAG: RNA polymerase sigma factor [Maricaulaceae bacterium]